MPTSRSPKSRKPSRRAAKTGRPTKSRASLPTAVQFEAMIVTKRTRVFAAWLKRQPRRREYDWGDVEDCPLGRFARAIFGKGAQGAVHEIDDPSHRCHVVFPRGPLENALYTKTTFGQASDAFQAALKVGR